MFLEGVYSWRTGSDAVSGPPGSPPIRSERQGEFGLITPTDRGSLLERLASRKAYLEEFQRAAFPAETDAGGFSSNRVSTTDSGHLFGTLKVLRDPYRGILDYYLNSTNYYKGDIWASVSGNLIYNQTPYSFGFPRSDASPLTVSALARQATANKLFSSTAPDRKDASLGQTLIELLRGDIPSLLKNFRSLMDDAMTLRKYAGSEALNIMFGWTPLINEAANVVKIGMTVERAIYYESFRRKRQWDGPSMRQDLSGNILLSSLNTPFLSSSLIYPGETQGGSSGGGSVTYSQQKELVAYEDYHFASRYTGLAKAGRRAESFSDQAMDTYKRLGLVEDPTLLWDLMPYSWLVDWFSTMGDSIANAATYSPISGKYSSDYAYLTTQHVVSTEGHLLRKVSGVDPTVLSHSIVSGRSGLICTSKWRTRATPFGFGTQLGSLNAGQYAILVALGFAKAR